MIVVENITFSLKATDFFCAIIKLHAKSGFCSGCVHFKLSLGKYMYLVWEWFSIF